MKTFLPVLFLVFLVGTSGVNNLFAQAWVTVGSTGFMPDPSYAAIAVGGNTPYVVSGNNARVMKFDSTSWVNVGAPVTPSSGSANTSIAIDKNSVPYVVYVNFDDGQKATVAKFNGSSWVTVGSAGFTGNPVTNTVIAIDTAGIPYVAYTDYGHAQKVTVMKFNGTSWVTVGSAGFSAGASAYVSLAINKAGSPYVAYQDVANNKHATAMTYNGSTWVTVGSPAFSDDSARYTSIALDTAGTPHAAYSDALVYGSATVKKYNGASWVTVDYIGFSGGGAASTNIAIDKNNKIYVAYLDYSHGGGVTVMTLIGGWVPVGEMGVGGIALSYASSDLNYCAISIGDSGIPYVLYHNMSYQTVAKLDTALAPITGPHIICAGTTTTFGELKSGGTWSSSDPSTATVNTSGVVTGLYSGEVTISYTKGGSPATTTVFVDSLPYINFETYGVDSVCIGGRVFIFPEMSTWSIPVPPGSWINQDTSVAVIIPGTGYISLEGRLTGMASLLYIATNICGTDTTSYSFRIGDCREGVNNLTALPDESIEIYPNPATLSLTISATEKICTVAISNLVGQTLLSREYNSPKAEVDVSTLSAGVYLVRINDTEVRRFVKE